MAIDFGESRWERLRADTDAWWRGELDRPLLILTCPAANPPDRPRPEGPDHPFTAFYADDVPAETIIDRRDWTLSNVEYLGDAFPTFWPNYGPGVLAAMCGGSLHSDGAITVWFGPPDGDGERPLSAYPFRFDPESKTARRLTDVYRAAAARWGGQVVMGMSDLGGNYDVLSSFRPGENLMLDMYDDPDTVKAASERVFESWWRAFDYFRALKSPADRGHTSWTPIFSHDPWYMFQSDFCYMIGPDMFGEFILPELAKSFARVPRSFYHLDGKGELPHLDQLLANPDLTGIQWVPGDGMPPFYEWPEVYRRIFAAGKLTQTFGPPETLDRFVDTVGTARGVAHIGWCKTREEGEACLKKYGYRQ